ncbi:PadR family transcriptional regulator [Paraconexibacter sp. AEG42_29]
MTVATDRSRGSQVLRGALDVCLLAVISEEPVYGYAITKALTDRGLASVGEGSIYPVLGRLERAGLVHTFRRESESGGPPRKYYVLSPDGETALDSWREHWVQTRSAIDRVLQTTKEHR